MPEILTEVTGDEDEDCYQLTPYGKLFMALGSNELARRACNALAGHMQKFRQSIYVDEAGLHFEPGLTDEDHAIITKAILWHELTHPDLHPQAETDLHEAVEAARRKVWAQRRD